MGHCPLLAHQPASMLSQAAVMELHLWRWPSWRLCPPSHTAVLLKCRPGLDRIQNLLSPPFLGQTLWEHVLLNAVLLTIN